MGITMTELHFNNAMKSLLVLCFQVSFLHPAIAQPGTVPAASLEATINTIDQLLNERTDSSEFNEPDARLLAISPYFSAIDWSSQNQPTGSRFSQNFRTLIFYAVCKEEARAVSKVAAIQDRFGGGFFTDSEIQYLNDLTKKLALGVRFDVDPLLKQQNLKSINQARRITTATRNGDFETALRLVPRFYSLCGTMSEHSMKQPPKSRTNR